MNQRSFRVVVATGCALLLAALVPASTGTANASSTVGRVTAPLAGAVKFPWFGGPVVVAHRGASQVAPENTLAAVDAAERQGFEWVENDVQQTRDGKLVVVHDATLARTTNVEQLFPQRSPGGCGTSRPPRSRGWTPGAGSASASRANGCPRSRSSCAAWSRDLRLLLEIKNPQQYPGIESRIIRELAGAGWLDRSHVRRRLVVQSFSATSVRTVHGLVPQVRTGFLGNPPVNSLASYSRYVDQINPQLSKVNAQYVSAVHRLHGVHGNRMEVFAWDVPPRNYHRIAAAYGFDGVIV